MDLMRCAVQSIIFSSLLLITGVFITPVFGQVMESSNWKISQDSINFGGGWSASDNYTMEDTYGEIATGWSYSDEYSLHAGYQQMDQETYISLTMATATTMLPSIPGLSGGTATGSTEAVVKTNNIVGYTLEINASTTPAMQKADLSKYFSDYTPAGANPDYNWTIPNTTSEFGFTPVGDDVIQRYLDNGADECNESSGSSSNDKCWDNFTLSAKVLSVSNSANELGTTTTVNLKAESGNQNVQVSGSYYANLTVTAYVN